MKERPILFSAPMVRAILAGTKTQTRRVVKHQPHERCTKGFVGADGVWRFSRPTAKAPISHADDDVRCPYGKPGDRLWVREAWSETDREDGTPVIAYRAGGNIAIGRDHPKGNDYLIDTIAWDDMPHVETWRPSIHMPRWASRILLEITAIRVERLQDISDADAVSEGVCELPGQAAEPGCWWTGDVGAGSKLHGRTPYVAYRLLWEQINGPGSWDANPWVWVVEFKRIEGKP